MDAGCFHSWDFRAAKTPGSGYSRHPAGLKQRINSLEFGAKPQTPKNQKAQPFWFGIHAGLKQWINSPVPA
jgi:hypothetical protein